MPLKVKFSILGMFMRSQERNVGEARRDTIIDGFAALFLESFQCIGVINYKRILEVDFVVIRLLQLFIIMKAAY